MPKVVGYGAEMSASSRHRPLMPEAARHQLKVPLRPQLRQTGISHFRRSPRLTAMKVPVEGPAKAAIPTPTDARTESMFQTHITASHGKRSTASIMQRALQNVAAIGPRLSLPRFLPLKGRQLRSKASCTKSRSRVQAQVHAGAESRQTVTRILP